MKVKQLKELIDLALQDNSIGLESEVVVVGEYGYGIDTCNPYVDVMGFTNEDAQIKPKPVLCIGVDEYVREPEDIGCSDTWLCTQDYKDFLEVENEN